MPGHSIRARAPRAGGLSAVALDRSPDAVAAHLEDAAHRPTRGNDRFRLRRGVFGNPQDAAVAADEDHVERDVGVLHPEAGRLFLMEVEQHALPFRQLATKHEPSRHLLRRRSHLDREDVHAALACDLERLQFGRREAAGNAGGRQGQDGQRGEENKQATAHGQGLD